MRHLNGVYTQRYNSVHGYDGQSFRGRFKSILVEKDKYLLEIVRYIHRNPLRAGMVGRLEDYKWFSHGDYLVLRQGGECLIELGQDFGMSGYSPAGSAVVRVVKKMHKNQGLLEQIEKIKHSLLP